jgi:hypothetical protein
MTSTPSSTRHTSDLGEYLKSELYDKWAIQRQPVEQKWLNNENAYKGVSEGMWKAEEGADWRSNTFIKMTKIKVLTAYSMVIDMLGDLPFALELSPWDEIVLEDLPEEQREKVQDDIDDMTGLIRQQILDCKGPMELIKCVMSAARYGETYWKSFIHQVMRKGFRSLNMAEGMSDPTGQYQRFEVFENEITAPAFKYVSCWNMFRDMETDDMQKSTGCCERSYTSPWGLRQLMDKPYYIKDAIEDVIKENDKAISTTSTDTLPPGIRGIKDRYNTIEKLEFWCRVPRNIVEQFEAEQKAPNKKVKPVNVEPETDGDEVEVGVCMAAEHVIRLMRIKPDTRPHGRVVWEINLDDNHGIGVADNCESIQMVLNGMVRAFEDNKKLSANVIAAVKKALITDWGGEFKPGELIEISEEAKTAAEAIQQIIFQDVGESLISGIGLMERYGDEVTMLPKISQGNVAEKRKPDTLGEIQILQSNAGKYIGSVIKNFDGDMVEPITTRFYEYNMLDHNVTKGKGNYISRALGFAGFQKKIVRLTKILQALNLALSSPTVAAETRIKTLLEEAFKALDIDPDKAFKTREEKEQEAQAIQQAQQAQFDQAGIAMLAKIKAEMEKEVEKIREQAKAKLEQIEEEHQNKMEQIDAESENRILEKRMEPASESKST